MKMIIDLFDLPWKGNKSWHYLFKIQVRERLLDRSLPLEKRLEIDVAGGFKAQVSMKLPPDYNPTRFQSYPMLVYV